MKTATLLSIKGKRQPPDAEIHRVLTDKGFTGPHYLKVGVEYRHPTGHIIWLSRDCRTWEHWKLDDLVASDNTFGSTTSLADYVKTLQPER